MTMFGITPTAVEQVLQLDGQRYFLASSSQAAQVEGVRRAWDVKRVPRQDGDPSQEFSLPLSSFHNGYGYSFSDQPGVYEMASGWDLSAQDKAKTWPRFTTAASQTSVNYRGWLYWNASNGCLYMLRGSYATKYQVDDVTTQWATVERHYFGANIVVAGKPAEFQNKLYVPLVDISVPGTETLAIWQELTTFATTTAETQTLTESGTPTGGTFVLRWTDGLTTTDTSALAYNITAAAMQTALQLIPGLEAVTVARSGAGPANFVWTVTMTGAPTALTTASPSQFTLQTNSLTGGAGPTITPATTSAGVGDTWTRSDNVSVAARTFCVWQKPTVGPLLVRANANNIATCSTTPTTAANWGTVQPVGDSGARINALATMGRLLYAGKEDTVWSIDETGQGVMEIPAISQVRDSQNCVGMTEYNGFLLIPHKIGLVHWRPGSSFYSSWGIIGAEQEGAYEGERSIGWGSVAGLAPYGKYCYQTVNDLYNSMGIVGSLIAGNGGPRGSLTPHMHQAFTPFVEDICVAGITGAAIAGHTPSTWSDDNAVGTVTWSNTANAASTDATSVASATPGTTHYLKGLNPNPVVPTSAVIKGIKLTYQRKAYVAAAATTTKSYTGAAQTYVVPAGVTSLLVDVIGAGGGAGRSGAAGGKGVRVQTTITVTPAETLDIYVGGAGHSASTGTGGFNGGGAGGAVGSIFGGGGGGASDIRRSGTKLVIAAGGGGSSLLSGGNGAAPDYIGSNGQSNGYGGGGIGGFLTLGGPGGSPYLGGSAGSSGSLGSGGAGGAANTSNTYADAGGGGGAGYYGGGGGGGAHDVSGGPPQTYGGGGGGGSSYSSGTGTVATAGYNSSNGSVVITPVQTTNITDNVVKLVQGGSVVGTNYASAAAWGSAFETATYGGANDLWGTTWNAAQVNASTFGFVLSAVVTTGTAQIYNAQITVYYTTTGVTDPASFLAVITLDTTRTIATPYIYKLPRAGMPVANDPFVEKATSNAYFRTSRYDQPSRNVQKIYRSIEFYIDLDPETNTPGFQMYALVEDGDFYPLLDGDGNVATVTASGFYELFFPTTSAAVGRWVQFQPTVPALGGSQVACSVDLREMTVHGMWMPAKTEEVTATLVLKEGGQFEDGFTDTRTVEQQLADLDTLNDPRGAGRGVVSLTDPVKRKDGYCTVETVGLRPIRFKERHEDTWVATVTLRKMPYD